MTIVYRPEDIGPLIALDFGTPVTIAGTPGLGIVDENDSIVVTNNGRAEVITGVHTVQVETAAFPTITNGQAIIVDGVTYSVRQRQKEGGDGGLTKILLGSV
jgi:hypothetical protein